MIDKQLADSLYLFLIGGSNPVYIRYIYRHLAEDNGYSCSGVASYLCIKANMPAVVAT